MSLPSGYNSVGERGGALSGGQRQRIALLDYPSESRLLIMDEATSARITRPSVLYL